ncbi:MAG: 3'(2'),5'-bisphosphate nucleotidase CysQ [Burkholderiales bacterium]|nr:3'(2'),5'-bisphosphate nucleotidase CysQ [Burkholderiales bacterium]
MTHANGSAENPLIHANSGQLLEAVAGIARRAGERIMAVYQGEFEVGGKDDGSPVTVADQLAEALILDELGRLDPSTPIVAEESVAAGRVPDVSGGRFWLVDPLDGTKEFIGRNGEFTVNIALIEDGAPVLGVVLAPAIGGAGGRLFAGIVGKGAWVEDSEGRRALRCRAVPEDGLTVVASRSHGDAAALEALLAGRRVARLTNAGSSLKLCLVAEGLADLYPRQGRTMEWDIAAGHAVLCAAGGSVRRLDDAAPLRYGKQGFDNPHFVAAGH